MVDIAFQPNPKLNAKQESREHIMALDPGPMQVIPNFHTSKAEVLDDIKKLDLWPTVYVSERMGELPPHWHNIDNCGYVMEGSSYVIDENGKHIPLKAGDKLHIPAGAIHAEGKVTERMVYIVGVSEPGNLLELLSLLPPETSPLG
ncbi:MAG: quercetin dioxygenase-like cupin family protein [Candidatus Azotimanducaceae bacterium]|jgi:quercetin dioxygenase-like cupin family protein